MGAAHSPHHPPPSAPLPVCRPPGASSRPLEHEPPGPADPAGSCRSHPPLERTPALESHSCLGEGCCAYRSFGYSSLKSRLFRVVQSRIFSILMTMSLPCQRPFHNCRETGGDEHCEGTHGPRAPLSPSRGVVGLTEPAGPTATWSDYNKAQEKTPALQPWAGAVPLRGLAPCLDGEAHQAVVPQFCTLQPARGWREQRSAWAQPPCPGGQLACVPLLTGSH